MKSATRSMTIVLDTEVARWARRAAAELDTSVSRFLGALLRERMLADRGYETAMRSFLSQAPVERSEPGPYPTRDEIHERQR